MMGEGIEADLSRALHGGFSGFSGSEGSRGFIDGKPDVEARQAQYDAALESYVRDKEIAELFGSQLGQRVLHRFKNESLMRVQFNPSLPKPEQSGFFHAGEANWVLRIMNAITGAQKGPPQLPPELAEGGGESND